MWSMDLLLLVIITEVFTDFIQIMCVGHITKDFSLYEEQKNHAMLVTIVHIDTNQLTSLNVSSDFDS